VTKLDRNHEGIVDPQYGTFSPAGENNSYVIREQSFESSPLPLLLQPDLSLTCCLAALIEVIRVRFQRGHHGRCADVQPAARAKKLK
jgi:hypothetical protein